MRTKKQNILEAILYVMLGLGFGLGVWYFGGGVAASQYYTAFILEKMLSVDNLFVFLLIFSYFQVPEDHKRKILFWGILGAIFFRTVFILGGSTIINLPGFEPLTAILALVLIWSGIQLLCVNEEIESIGDKKHIQWMQKNIPFDPTYHHPLKFIKDNKITISLLVLFIVEVTDVIFALDSVPAVLLVSQNPWVILSSNLFAVLGLRALFFVLEDLLAKLKYLNYGLSIILIFIGIKSLVTFFFEYHLSTVLSLGVVVSVLLCTVLFSIFRKD